MAVRTLRRRPGPRDIQVLMPFPYLSTTHHSLNFSYLFFNTLYSLQFPYLSVTFLSFRFPLRDSFQLWDCLALHFLMRTQLHHKLLRIVTKAEYAFSVQWLKNLAGRKSVSCRQRRTLEGTWDSGIILCPHLLLFKTLKKATEKSVENLFPSQSNSVWLNTQTIWLSTLTLGSRIIYLYSTVAPTDTTAHPWCC